MVIITIDEMIEEINTTEMVITITPERVRDEINTTMVNKILIKTEKSKR
jgi:hypothetical protein